ncbi:MAG TPA: cytochrome c [Sphingobium sp.]|nr:cytochrome c [Sphingobium sp.]
MSRQAWTLLAAPLLLVGVHGCHRSSEAPGAPDGSPPLSAPETVLSRPDAGPGEGLYLEKCAMCHGPGGMGSGLLARRNDQPLLTKRTDLTVDFVVQAARTGIGNMPAIPRGEVSDADMALIADYLVSAPGAAR